MDTIGETEGGVRSDAHSVFIRVLGVLATLALVTLMAHVMLNVTMRYFFRTPVRDTFEIVGYWYLPIIALTGFVWAQWRGAHIETELVYNIVPARSQRDLRLLGYAFATVISALFAYYTTFEAIHAVEKQATAGASDVPTWPVMLLVPVAFAALTVMNANLLVRGFGPKVEGGTDKAVWIFRGIVVVAIGLPVLAMIFAGSKVGTAAAGMVLLLVLLFLKVPVAFTLLSTGLFGLWLLRPRSVFTELHEAPYEAVANWSLSVIPMFVFMGLLLWRSGLTAKIYEVASEWLRWLPGGLAVSTTVAGTGLAAVSGSTLGTTYALSRIGIPEMLRAGYDRRIAVGAVMVAGLPGQLIPPSTLLVIYSGIAEVPIGPQLMAGIIPGLMVSAVFVLALILMSTFRPRMVGTGHERPVKPFPERLRLLATVWPIPVLIFVVLGGMYSGVMTATEAGAAGVLGSLILTVFAQGKEAWEAISSAALEAVSVTGAIFLILIGAETLTDLLAISGLTRGFTTWMASTELDRITLLLLLFGAYLVMGMFMEPLPIMILTVPLLVPVLGDLGVSPLWFGVFVVLVAELAMLTPPVGILSFIVHGIVRDPEVNLGQNISLKDIFVAVAIFMPIAILAGILLIFFPEMATWLPDRM